MAESIGRGEKGLWRRWRSAAGRNPAGAEAPDALELAAYAEHRLGERAAEAVEEWLAANPESLVDLLATQRAGREGFAAAPAAITARLSALIVEGDGQQIIPLRRPATRPSWRRAAAWGAMAACLVVTSLVGFTLGNDAYVTIAGVGSPALSQDLLDTPIGLFNTADEDSQT